MTPEGCRGARWDLVAGLWAPWLSARELLKLVTTWAPATCTHSFRENYQGFQGAVQTALLGQRSPCSPPWLSCHGLPVPALQHHRNDPGEPCLPSPNLLVQFAFFSTQFRPTVSQVLESDPLYQLPMFSSYITTSILTFNISSYLGQ